MEAAPAAPARHEPDYFMKNFAVRTFDEAGRLKNEIFGADARHFPDTDTLEVDDVRIRSFNEEGHLTTATAKRALTNGDASEVELFGNARIIREAVQVKVGKDLPRLEFRGEYLHADMKNERIKSSKPVELSRGRDTFTGDTMNFDSGAQVMRLDGRVKGTLMPNVGP
jgi:lipopolysaccharide export system protein LptC